MNPYNKETEPASWKWYEEKPREVRTAKVMQIKDDNLPTHSGVVEISRKDKFYHIVIEDIDQIEPSQELYLHPREFGDLCRAINGLTEYVNEKK